MFLPFSPVYAASDPRLLFPLPTVATPLPHNPPKSFTIRTSEKHVCNPFRIRSYKKNQWWGGGVGIQTEAPNPERPSGVDHRFRPCRKGSAPAFNYQPSIIDHQLSPPPLATSSLPFPNQYSTLSATTYRGPIVTAHRSSHHILAIHQCAVLGILAKRQRG
jgi:hypothetical protein